MNIRLIGAAALLAVLGGSRANAQITTVIAPPKRVDANAQAVAQREQVAQDSIARVTLTGMKEWVDSAAQALALSPDTGATRADTGSTRADTAAAAQNPSAPTRQTTDSTSAKPRASQATEFRDGARAPNTATPVPTIALLGAAMVLMGLAIGRRREAPAKSRSPR